MADAVATQTIQDGQKMVVQKFTNVSDGSGESAVVKQTSAHQPQMPVVMPAQVSPSKKYGGSALE